MTHLDSDSRIREQCALVVSDATALAPLRGTSVLITGGTGFMGTWLTELLTHLNDHHDFGVEINLLSSQAETFRARVPHLAGRSDVTLLQRDIRSVVDLPEELNYIIHAAASPDTRLHASDPLRVMQVISQGTAAVLEAATRLPDLRKFVNVSSGLIYGAQPHEMPGVAERYVGGLDCASVSMAYAEAKRFGETLCAGYRSQHRLPIVGARPFAFVGPYQLLDRPWAINNFIRDGIKGGPIRIQGDGRTVRSYMYGSDMAWWMLNILVRAAPGQIFNVGSPQEISLHQLAERISAYFQWRPEIMLNVAAERSPPPSRFVPDVSLARDSLGLSLTVNLDTAIQRAVTWYQEREKRPSRGVERQPV